MVETIVVSHHEPQWKIEVRPQTKVLMRLAAGGVCHLADGSKDEAE